MLLLLSSFTILLSLAFKIASSADVIEYSVDGNWSDHQSRASATIWLWDKLELDCHTCNSAAVLKGEKFI